MGSPGGPSGEHSRWNAGRSLEIGKRVVVRRHLKPGETSHLFTDVIGHVIAIEPELRVRRASGEEVSIPEADIAVLKVLPARPVRNRDIREWEYVSALGWPGAQFALVDGWMCRAGDDWSYRQDSAVPVLPWASVDALDGVRDWYASRGLPLRLAVVDRLVDLPGLRLDGQAVDAARITSGRELGLCVGESSTLVDRAPDSRHRVRIADSAGADWLALYHGTAGLDPSSVLPALCAAAELRDDEPTPGGEVGFARLEIDGALAAIARGVVSRGPSGRARLGISCVETAQEFRRHGLAEIITAALGTWGLERGAEQCHLHVFADNSAGAALWSKLGLEVHHYSHYVRID